MDPNPGSREDRTVRAAIGGYGETKSSFRARCSASATTDDRRAKALKIRRGLKQREALPECEDMGEGRDISRANRIERPKLTEEEIEKLKRCVRPLTKTEWREMRFGTQ